MKNENRITFRKIMLRKFHSKTRKVWQLYINNKRMSKTYIYEISANATIFRRNEDGVIFQRIGYEGIFRGYHLNIVHPSLIHAKRYLVKYINEH